MGEVDKIKILSKSVTENGSSFAQTTSNGWRIIAVKSRVDSFNQDALMDEVRGLAGEGCKKVALDLRANRFISLPVIKCCVEVAERLRREGGQFALVGCSEKTKRHFEIYGSLDQIQVVRLIAQLPGSGAIEIEDVKSVEST